MTVYYLMSRSDFCNSLDRIQDNSPTVSVPVRWEPNLDIIEDVFYYAYQSKSKLLVLPSENEPFPMIVLESLAVGTPVLVMPSCGISHVLANFEPRFVSPTEDVGGLQVALQQNLESNFHNLTIWEIASFCNEVFGIHSVVTTLCSLYQKAVSND